jgi:hypothetical protein
MWEASRKYYLRSAIVSLCRNGVVEIKCSELSLLHEDEVSENYVTVCALPKQIHWTNIT